MDPEHSQRVLGLYQEAIARPDAERADFLANACAGDEILKRDVESLLVSRARSLFEHFAAPELIGGEQSVSATDVLSMDLGVYHIVGELGKGGMGKVYRARDTKLEREVALKILPDNFAHDRDRVARFQREARALASLNHPHIAQIHGLDEANGLPFLVLELVDGESLDKRVARGRVPVDEALAIGKEITEALEAAHEKGIIHRDLKPANIALTKEGTVKVLDFGLAKMAVNDGASPDLTTSGGIRFGTPAYMSPEQVLAKPGDKRIDIWAFGCVLFEILAGRSIFARETVSDTLAAVLEHEPAWDRLPAATPDSVRRLLRRCLEKDAKSRLRDMGDASLELEDALAGLKRGPGGRPKPARMTRYQIASLGAVAALLTILVVLGALSRVVHSVIDSSNAQRPQTGLPPPEGVVRFSISPPEQDQFREVAVSPDGRHIALVAFTPGDPDATHLWLRDIDDLSTVLVRGVHNPSSPFWSPDSQFIAFFADGKLWKVRIDGHIPEAIANVHASLLSPRPGGTWNRDGVILLTDDDMKLRQVSAQGGTPKDLFGTSVVGPQSWPEFLRDDRHFLYTVNRGAPETVGIYVGSIDSQNTFRILETPSRASLGPPSSVLFLSGNSLWAAALDLDHRRITGEPISVTEGLAKNDAGYPVFSASSRVLAYVAKPPTQLIWVNRQGKLLETITPPGDDFNPALSPDEQRLAFNRRDSKTKSTQIFVFDFPTRQTSPLTFGPASSLSPTWSPDGTHIVFASSRGGPAQLFQVAANGKGTEEQLTHRNTPSPLVGPCDWSSDGYFILYRDFPNLMVLPMAGGRTPFSVGTGATGCDAQFSPNGRWLVTASFEDLLVTTFPSDGSRGATIVPSRRMRNPKWRRDGKELFYVSLSDGKLMAIAVDGDRPLRSVNTTSLFDMPGIMLHRDGVVSSNDSLGYAVNKDGQRFVINRAGAEGSPVPVAVLVNWTAGPRK
jgi:Tol biopolymer transport system component